MSKNTKIIKQKKQDINIYDGLTLPLQIGKTLLIAPTHNVVLSGNVITISYSIPIIKNI